LRWITPLVVCFVMVGCPEFTDVMDCDDCDWDGDTYSPADGDCNDLDPLVNPWVPESCNGYDDNCDGTIDEGFDNDGDGWVTCGGDCDDADPEIHPGQPEICNGIDDTCDGIIDEGCEPSCE